MENGGYKTITKPRVIQTRQREEPIEPPHSLEWHKTKERAREDIWKNSVENTQGATEGALGPIFGGTLPDSRMMNSSRLEMSNGGILTIPESSIGPL